MWERFTHRSRRVIVLAQEEARLLGHSYIGTEHLLLGLLADAEGDAARALQSLDVTLEAAREQVRSIAGEGPPHQQGHVPFAPQAKKVLELSLREALALGSQSIGTVHLLLGLLAEGEGAGAQIIERLGARLTTVRERAVALAGNEPDPATGLAETAITGLARTTRVRVEGLGGLHQLLAVIERRLARIETHLGITAPPEDEPAQASPAPAPRPGAGPGSSPGDDPSESEAGSDPGGHQ